MKDGTDRPSQRMVMCDGVLFLDSRCTSTASGVRADYEALRWDIRKAAQYIQGKTANGTTPTVSDINRVFVGSLLVGDGVHGRFASEQDVEKLIENPAQGPSKLAQELIAKGTGLTLKTVQTYTKNRAKNKNRRRKPTR